MELVTVTCDRDFQQTVLQAHSLDKFLLKPCVHWIIIENSNRPISYWQDKLNPYYTRNSLKLIHSNSILGSDNLPGYFRQQLIKLKISELVSSNSYLVLDSKDLLIRPVTVYDWGDIEGNSSIYYPPENSTTLEDILGPDLKWNKTFLEVVEKNNQISRPNFFWAPVTPFRLKTNSVKKLNSSLDIEHYFNPIVNSFSRQASEFLLYRYFSDTDLKIPVEKLGLWATENNTKFLWAGETLEENLSVLRNDFYKSVSFHRWYIVNNGSRIHYITDVLINEIGLDSKLVNLAFDVDYWNLQTWGERGHPIFEEFNLGFRKN
jgi:hypothetical protein